MTGDRRAAAVHPEPRAGRSSVPNPLSRTLQKWDIRVAEHLARTHTDPRLDTALRRLSRAANRGRLWMGVSAGLTLTGSRGRIAAGHGLAALAGASAVANLIVKPLVGGERPDPSILPLPRRLRRQPLSGAFPSGHSASAAAFATAASLSWPAAAPVLVPLAGTIAYSRVHTGAHWLSDVVGGTALGVGVGATVHLLTGALSRLPPEGPGARRGGKVAPRVQAPALPAGEGLTIVVNPQAGHATDTAVLLARALPRAQVLGASVDGALPEDLDDLLSRAVSVPGTRALGVCGGDGTVATAAAAARAHHLPLVVLPGGTFNHFAKAIGVESIDDAAAAVTTGYALAVDVADLTTQVSDDPPSSPLTVLNTVALGAYPAMVTVRERVEDRWGRWWAGLAATATVVRHPAPLMLSVQDGPAHPSWLVFAGVNRYIPAGMAPVTRLRLDTGVLDVRDYRADASLASARLVGQSLLGRRGATLGETVPWLRVTPVDLAPAATAVFACPATDPVDPLQEPGVEVAHDGEIHRVVAPRGAIVRIHLTMAPSALVVYAP